MAPNLKAEERELIRLVNFFKRKVKTLTDENKATEDYTEMVKTCEKLVEQISIHAQSRDAVMEDRERLKGLIKEKALCPRCEKNTNLKFIGTDKSPEGWKCGWTTIWVPPQNIFLTY